MKILVIGGVAGGATVASRIKRLDESAEVIVFEKGPYVSFANCGLPYHLSNTIEERESLLIQTPEKLKKRSDFDTRVFHEVLKINPNKKTLLVKNIQNDYEYEESYDKLIIATGSKAFVPNIDGINHPKISHLLTMTDMDFILQNIKSRPHHVTVVGGGFIGLEVTENLVHAGHKVALVEKSSQVMKNLDMEMAQFLEKELVKNKVNLILNAGLTKVEANGSKLNLILDTGQIVETDFVVLAIGVIPQSSLAKEAGLALNDKEAIVVDKFLRTSDEHIYAVGDVIESYNIITDQKMIIPLAAPAIRQARLVAENVLGASKIYKGQNPTSICKLFSLNAASTGWIEDQLIKNNKSYRKVYTHTLNHPSYFPNSEEMHVKLLYSEEGQILGSQIVGGEGVDKRIDIMSIAVRQKLSVYDIAEQDFAYAPPFNSPKDPVQVASFVAINQLEGISTPIFELNPKKHVIIDVREKFEIEKFPASGTLWIPLGDLRSRISELDKSKTYVLFCMSATRSYLAERILKNHGFDVYNYSGGYKCYVNTEKY